MSLEIAPDLVRRLKRLRLGGLLPTLPDRATHARQAKLSPLEFLKLLLQDEIDRRDSQGLTLRVQAAGFDEIVTAEDLVWETPVHYDRTRVRELFRFDWLAAQENVIFCGPVGVGKSWFAEALGYSACRAGGIAGYGRTRDRGAPGRYGPGPLTARPRTPPPTQKGLAHATPDTVRSRDDTAGVAECFWKPLAE
jgi:hypothetical protein